MLWARVVGTDGTTEFFTRSPSQFIIIWLLDEMAQLKVTSAITKLTELRAMIDVDTDREFDSSEAGGRTLREAFLLACKKLGHEFLRFTLVIRASNADVGALSEVLPGLADAASSVVAGLQLLARPGVGHTLQGDYRRFGRALTQAVIDSVAPIAPASDGPLEVAFVAAQLQRMLHRAGVVLELVEQAQRLPVSNVAAVRRRLLQLAKLAKSSADDITREHAADGCAVDDSEVSEEADEDDMDEPPSPELLTSGCDALRATVTAVRTVIALSDAVARADAAVAAAEPSVDSSSLSPPIGGAASTSNPAASTSGVSAASGVSEVAWLDRVAQACDEVNDAVVDFAAAVSDNDEPGNAVTILRSAVSRLVAICDEQARSHEGTVKQLAELWALVEEQLSRVSSAAK